MIAISMFMNTTWMVKVAKMKKNQALEGKQVGLGKLEALRGRWELDSLGRRCLSSGKTGYLGVW